MKVLSITCGILTIAVFVLHLFKLFGFPCVAYFTDYGLILVTVGNFILSVVKRRRGDREQEDERRGDSLREP